MSLRLDVFKLMSFSLLNTVLTKLMGVVSFLVIVRLLSRSEIGLIGVIGGYVAILGFLSLGPESALVRDFPKIKSKINQHISAFVQFWFFRTLVIMIAAGGMSVWLYFFFNDITFSIYMIGIAIAINLNLFELMAKDVFYVDFKQEIVTKVTFVLKLVFLGMLMILLFYGYVLLYMCVLVVSAALNAGIWYYLLRKKFNFRFDPKGARNILKWNIFDYSLWAHLSNSFTALVYRIDTFILSFFATLVVIGDYTIALEIANFFFIVPRLLQKSVIVGTVNLKDNKRLNDVIFIFVKYFFILSVVQFVLFIIFGPWIVSLFTDTSVGDVYWYSILIISGVSILNVVRPISTLINTQASMRKGFFHVYLPASIIGIAAYVIMAMNYGVVGVAAANIIAFSVMSVFIVVFVKRFFPLKARFTLFGDIERGLLKDMKKK